MKSGNKQHLLLVALIALLFSACCTKQDCDYANYPALHVSLVDFNQSTRGYVKVFDDTSNVLVDSFRFSGNFFRIEHIDGAFDIQGKDFFIYSDNERIDTIENISFESYEFNNDCNKCFLADNSAIAIDYKNLEYTVNGTVFKDIETVEIQN